MDNINGSAGFLMTLDQAIEFYKRCKDKGAVTTEQRLAILAEMTKERRVFPQTEDQVRKRLTGKKVLKIGSKKEAPHGPNS